MERLRSLVRKSTIIDKAIKEFVCNKMLQNANQWRIDILQDANENGHDVYEAYYGEEDIDEEEKAKLVDPKIPITSQTFQKRLKLNEIVMFKDGNTTLTYECDGMFTDHAIRVFLDKDLTITDCSL